MSNVLSHTGRRFGYKCFLLLRVVIFQIRENHNLSLTGIKHGQKTKPTKDGCFQFGCI